MGEPFWSCTTSISFFSCASLRIVGDKVASILSVEPARPHNVKSVHDPLNVFFPGKFGFPIDIDRVRVVKGGVGRGLGAVKDIISTYVAEGNAPVLARQCEILDADAVHEKCLLPFLFRLVDQRVCRAIDHTIRGYRTHGMLYTVSDRDIEYFLPARK